MRVDQLIKLRKGGLRRVVGVGRLRYNISPSHSHWHLQPFERYELRTLDGTQIVRDHKSGFCLTSDHQSPLSTQGHAASRPLRGSDCARNKRRAKRLLEGIAVGWGDIYIPAKEGQSIDLVGYTPGEYDLVHRVNVGRVLRDQNYTTNRSARALSAGRTGLIGFTINLQGGSPNTSAAPSIMPGSKTGVLTARSTLANNCRCRSCRSHQR